VEGEGGVAAAACVSGHHVSAVFVATVAFIASVCKRACERVRACRSPLADVHGGVCADIWGRPSFGPLLSCVATMVCHSSARPGRVAVGRPVVHAVRVACAYASCRCGWLA
jgi:hypothetical protein